MRTHADRKRKDGKRRFAERKQTESCSRDIHADGMGFRTKAVTRDREGPGHPASGRLPKATRNTASTGREEPYVHCSSIYSSRDPEATGVPTNEPREKEGVCVYDGVFLRHNKKGRNLAILPTTRVDLEGVVPVERVREGRMPYDFIYLWNLAK